MKIIRKIIKDNPDYRNKIFHSLMDIVHSKNVAYIERMKKAPDLTSPAVETAGKTISFITSYQDITGNYDDQYDQGRHNRIWLEFEKILCNDSNKILLQVVEFEDFKTNGSWSPMLKIVMDRSAVDEWLKEQDRPSIKDDELWSIINDHLK